MSKFKGRLDKLKVKTHNFVSNQSFRVIRDFYRDLYLEREAKDEIDTYRKEYDELWIAARSEKNPETQRRLDEFIKQRPGCHYKAMYDFSSKECDKYPDGTFLPKYYTDDFLKTVTAAKAHFARKKHLSNRKLLKQI